MHVWIDGLYFSLLEVHAVFKDIAIDYFMILQSFSEFIFSDRASGVKEALQAEVEPRGETGRMAKTVSLGCLVLLDYR